MIHSRAATDAGSLHDLALNLLEFPKVREMLAGHTRFTVASEMAMQIQPRSSLEDVRRLQAETAEARLLLDTAGDIGLTGSSDVRPLAQRAALGGMLSGKELVEMAATLGAIWTAAGVVRSGGERAPLLRHLAEGITDHRWLCDRIFEMVSERGEVLDSATPRLGKLRAAVATSYRKLVRALERITGSAAARAALQSPVIAARGDRLVLEVKAENRRDIPGIVHDVSATGATVFIEPLAAVELCNQWREVAADAVREEEKALRRVSDIVGSRQHEVASAIEAAAAIDLIMARGRLAAAMRARPVEALEPESDPAVHLVEARHPLLGEAAVPVTVSIGPGFRALVITGPNTGGKTVALKTIGLCALMHQAGLQVPASADSRLSVFDNVYADIGDLQSIERSVSTFSSHFGNVVRILSSAGPASLVLLDELGTGTDPEEGAALAKSVLKHLVSRGIPTAITTHHRTVAEYAGQHQGMQNASVDLDPDTMMPTYRFIMGIPGRSYAISVASHLGLPAPLLEDARGMLDPGQLEAEALLSQLQRERAHLAEAAKEAAQERAEAEAARKELQARLASVHRREEDLVERTRRELRREADEVRRSLRRIVDETREDPNIAAARRAVERVRQAVSQPSWFPLAPPDQEPEEDDGQQPLQPGDVVEIKGLNVRASVLSVHDNGSVDLMMGNARIQLDDEQLRRVERAGKAPEPAAQGFRMDTAAIEDASGELDLRGERAADVREKLAGFLDRCALLNLSTCRIIHGRGTGAVREAVREVLAEHPQAAAFGPAERDAGGNGVTVVELA